MSEANEAILEFLRIRGIQAEIKPDINQACPAGKCEPYRYKRNHSEPARMLPHNHGHRYVLTLTKRLGTNIQRLVLDGFWNSINSRYDTLPINCEIKPGAIKATPNVYGMLSSYLSDVFANQETFKEYCENFGESIDSRSAERAYLERVEQAIKLQRFFSREELNELQELAQ